VEKLEQQAPRQQAGPYAKSRRPNSNPLLFARGGWLSLSSRRTTAISLYERGRRQAATALQDHCWLKSQCTTGPERRIPRWEHEHPLEAVQQRLDANPQALHRASRDSRASVRHDEGQHGATHLVTKTLPKVAAEMALSDTGWTVGTPLADKVQDRELLNNRRKNAVESRCRCFFGGD